MTIKLHPSIDNGFNPTKENFAGGVLNCKCESNTVRGQTAHNHACGCSKCWKPEGAIFSQIAVISRDNVEVVANADKLVVVDENAVIAVMHVKMYVYMYGRIEDNPPILWFRLCSH
ncbi:hypothetical protein [Photobacterium leiognathi]|uniref:hypothetical protein n=1 Tax=Photobacterium leiognathi TaxID=553611 RepID=UPI003F754EA7